MRTLESQRELFLVVQHERLQEDFASRLRLKYLREDLDVLRGRLSDLARNIELKLDDHEVGKLLTTIDEVGLLASACLTAELPARFRRCDREPCGRAPQLRQSAKKRFFSGSPTMPGQRSPTQGALDGGSQSRAMQSMTAPVLRTPSCRGQTWQGGRHSSYAEAARGGLEHSPPTLRPALTSNPRDRQRSDNDAGRTPWYRFSERHQASGL
jgi:hypothetical protein